MKIAVGSENPIKIQAVEAAFKKVWPGKKWNVIGVKVSSGVSDQPMSDAEAIKGATTRAKKSMKIAKADFGVGLEGGVNKIGNKWFDCGWMVIIDKKGRVGIGSGTRIETPQKIMRLLRQGRELGTANDILFGTKNSKQGQGHFGLMTNGILTRKSEYTTGLISALSRFLHPEIF